MRLSKPAASPQMVNPRMSVRPEIPDGHSRGRPCPWTTSEARSVLLVPSVIACRPNVPTGSAGPAEPGYGNVGRTARP